MIQNATKFLEMTVCFRVKMDFFTIIGDYMFLLDMVDGGRTERVLDFRIRQTSRDVILGHLGVEFTSGGTTIQLIYIETEQELKGSLK